MSGEIEGTSGQVRVGIDAGSRSVKVVASAAPGVHRKVAVIDTPRFYREFNVPGRDGSSVALERLGLPAGAQVSATGYGRNCEALRGAALVNEILAHVAGTVQATGLSDFVMLDIGGQDTKVARVAGGELDEIETNDRCAASCGRFLESAAAMLESSLQELSSHHRNPVELSSTCAVFAENEITECLARGESFDRIAAGVNLAVARKVEPMLRRLHRGQPVVFSGGVARNQAIAAYLREALDAEILVPADPEFNGALGCLALAEAPANAGRAARVRSCTS